MNFSCAASSPASAASFLAEAALSSTWISANASEINNCQLIIWYWYCRLRNFAKVFTIIENAVLLLVYFRGKSRLRAHPARCGGGEWIKCSTLRPRHGESRLGHSYNHRWGWWITEIFRTTTSPNIVKFREVWWTLPSAINHLIPEPEPLVLCCCLSFSSIREQLSFVEVCPSLAKRR